MLACCEVDACSNQRRDYCGCRLGRWVRVNHVYSGALSALLLSSGVVCVLALIRATGWANPDRQTYAQLSLAASVPLGLVAYMHYSTRAPYSGLSETVIYRWTPQLDSLLRLSLTCLHLTLSILCQHYLFYATLSSVTL